MIRHSGGGIRRRRPGQGLGTLLAVLTLCLRLAWPTPMPAPALGPGPADLAAALGEHALCLAASAGSDQAPGPRDGNNTPPDDHAAQHGLGCCVLHAGPGFLLPRIAALIPPAAPEACPIRVEPPTVRPVRLVFPFEARGPPEAV